MILISTSLASSCCPVKTECLCELGIYGIFLCDANDNGAYLESMEQTCQPAFVNKYGGYLLRVKSADSNEGGVAAGYAFLSSLVLVP